VKTYKEPINPRVSLGLFFGLLVLFSTLGIDGFPAGSALLREFGSRPTNLLLAVAFIGIVIDRLRSPGAIVFTRTELLAAVVALLGIPTINLTVTIMAADAGLDGPLTDWAKQYAMLLWGVTSFWLWRRLLVRLDHDVVGTLICLGAILPLAAFFGDLSGSTWVQDLLGLVRVKQDSRPSGLATEPSIYAAWVAFVWPLVLFAAIRGRSINGRLFAMMVFLGLCVSSYLSNARTIAVIVALQLGCLGYWVTRSQSGIARLRALAVILIVATCTLAVFSQLLSSLTDTDVGSNIGRIGSTVTALRVSLAYPLTGVGIGQLKYYFSAYAPDFALASDEIVTYAAGLSDYRASSFNLFVRFLCEFGFVAGLFFSYLVMQPILRALRIRGDNGFVLYATLSAVGGVGFWLSQDQYGYQPAILSLAILSNAVAACADHRPALR